jgi:ribosome-associated protein
MNKRTAALSAKDVADLSAKLADSRKAEQITMIELAGSSDMADWFVICQGDNLAHNRAIADAIVDGLKEMKVSAWHIEGLTEGRWIVLDYSDVVVHVMLSSVHDFYALEELWPKAKVLHREFHGDKSHAS